MRKIAPDKKKHFYVGILLGGVLLLLSNFLLSGNLIYSAVLAFLLLVVINYGFELFSKITGKGHYDFLDAVAGTLGGVLGMAVTLLILLNFY
jgi:hypothetical protein